MKTKEIYSLGTKASENPIRRIDSTHPFVRPTEDIQTLKNDLQWHKDEIVNLERDVKELQMELYDRESEIEDLQDEMDELKIRLETFEALES